MLTLSGIYTHISLSCIYPISQYVSIPLNLSGARDCYASTLMRKGKSRDDIGQMLGHSNSIVTEHYLSSIDPERTFEINSVLL